MTNKPIPSQAVKFEPNLDYFIFNTHNITDKVYETVYQPYFSKIWTQPIFI